MYDFYFGSKEKIESNEEHYLLFIKRMLPRWTNSIPDSEYLALHRLLAVEKPNGRPPVLVETGVGASTIVLLNHVLKHNGVLYSWDLNGLKGSYLRGVITDTLLNHYEKPISLHWKFIAYNSHSAGAGLPILKEIGVNVDFCFLDSEHTRDVLLGEVERLQPVLRDGAIVAIDDANYDYIHTNTAYVNMIRKKLGLTPFPEPEANHGKLFYEEVERFLHQYWGKVEHLADTYKKEFKDDLFWTYYDADRKVMGEQGMEKWASLEHRFDSWRVSAKRVG